MPLVFLPRPPGSLFLWGDDVVEALVRAGTARAEVEVVGPGGKRKRVEGRVVGVADAAARLAAIPAADLERLPPSASVWALASKLAMSLVARERVVPVAHRAAEGVLEVRWAAALSGTEDVAAALAIAQSMPPSAHAVPLSDAGDEIWTAGALLSSFLDAVADALVRQSARASRGAAGPSGWEGRFIDALAGSEARFEPSGFRDRSVGDDLERWSEPARGARDRLRACFRLELPKGEGAPFVLRFLLQSPDDPSLLVDAREVWTTRGRSLQVLGRAFRDPHESLLEALGHSAVLFPPIAESLSEAAPARVALDATGAWAFLNEGAALLQQAGFGVVVPAELTAAGRRRLRLRMRVGGHRKVAGAVPQEAGLGLEQLLEFDWEAAIGDDKLTPEQLAAIARQKAPLVRYRGQWIAVDPAELARIEKLEGEGGTLTVREALGAVLAGETDAAGPLAGVIADGTFARLLERLRGGERARVTVPDGLTATLRPYQERGLAWLATLAELGLGACLADDMGLGKTIQLLAFVLHRLERAPAEPSPALLVAPTSVVGNWEREVERFAPGLSVFRHYGTGRVKSAGAIPRGAATLVVTTYAVLRRDVELLGGIDWSLVALDEAQNVKNAASATARAARTLRAPRRFALTGTPVENRLGELWSIFEFANPGLLGPLEKFRRELAFPIERYGSDTATAKLERVVRPFLLRRVKSDPTVVKDLPPKNESKVICTLTREQATLYQAAVDEEMRSIEEAEGMERRGRVLALLTALKQICNHPAQYLGEAGPLERRSGKLARLTEMLEEAIAAGDRALVFTQFREMGDRLVRHLGAELGASIAFLHGGVPKRARDEMVDRFQNDPRGPRIFVLSLRAGGTGLNLTAASHVFHFDRWWNPAVEDQATDRAHRIGQTRTVQVHKLLCAGTVEEKVDAMLEQKRALASRIVRTGESFITELDDRGLRDLFALSADASVATDEPERAAAAPKRRRAEAQS